MSDRVDYYRTIMRVFFSQHREFYKYQLTASEVWEAVRERHDPTYTLDKCQTDLRALQDWGNLIITHDSSRHTSIQSFLSPALLYQATPLAIALETFLDSQLQIGIASGALRQGDIPRLWKIIETVDKLLNEAKSVGIENADKNAIYDEWRAGFELFQTMAGQAAQYLATMTDNARRSRITIESYQSYKKAVIEYVTNFGQTLSTYSVGFRDKLNEWLADGKAQILIVAIADNLQPPEVEAERRQPAEMLFKEANRQLVALAEWFAPGKNADIFRRRATAEVDKVVRRAEQLSGKRSANYANDLDRLARRLLEATDPEETCQLSLIAFGHALPSHLPENLAGTSDQTTFRSAWQEPPGVTPILRTLGRTRSDKTTEEPIRDNREAQQAFIRQQELIRRQELERFQALFATGSLNVGEIWVNSTAERAALLVVVRSCLRDNQNQYQAPDGSIIKMLNPAEKDYGLLKAPDGSLLMPRYNLVVIKK